MNKSFDDKMRERLAGYAHQPPKGAKELILGRMSSATGGLIYFYHTLSAVFILVALFKIGGMPDRVEEDSLPAYAPSASIEKINGSIETADSKSDMVIVEKQRGQQNHPLPAATEKTDRNEGENMHGESPAWLIDEWELNKRIKPSEPTPDVPQRALAGVERIDSNIEVKKIVPEKRIRVQPYYNAGAFFIYNRFRPDLDDDIYVGAYDAPFSLSASRLGLVGEVGLQRQWSDFFALRVGISLSNYGQSYSFTVRNTRPDSVSIDEENQLMEPHFDTENVQISKRVTVAGLKVQGFWSVFQNTSNVLFASVEYQKLFGRGPQFTYLDKDYHLMKPLQLLTEVGLKKQIIKLKTGDIHAMPNIRYSLNKLGDSGIIDVKPFSVGVTISYSSR